MFHHGVVLESHKHDRCSVDDERNASRRHKAALDFTMTTRMIPVARLRFASTASSSQLVNSRGDFRSRFAPGPTLDAIAITSTFWLETKKLACRARLVTSCVVVNPTNANMMQRTPENQVQQQRGDGGETTNNGHS
jgi:hypothetical protein